MALQPGLLDTSIISRGARESKIDLATPVNIYTSLQANKRANQQEKRTQSLADLTLSREEQQARKRAQFQEILRSSLNEKGQIDSEKAVAELNRNGFVEQAFALQEKKRKAFEAKSKQRLETNFEMGRSFGAVLKSENPVEAFMIARNDAVKQGLPISDGLLNYFPTDEEIQDGRLDPKVAIELDYLSQRATRPKGPMSIEDKLLLMNKLYEEKKNLAKVKSDIKVEQPLTEGQKQKERLAGKKDIRAEKTLGLKEAELELKKDKAVRETEKWEEQKEQNLLKHKKMKDSYKNQIQKFDRFMVKAAKVANNPNLKYTTGAGRYHPTKGKNIPKIATVGKDIQADIDNLVGMGSLNTILEMKQSSATGATGFGALSAPELKILQDALASLTNDEISVNKKREILLEAVDVVEKYQDRVEEFESKYNLNAPENPEEKDALNENDLEGF